MTEQNNHEQTSNQAKKVSLADAIKNKLNQKKQFQMENNKSNLKGASNNLALKNQHSKKINSIRRKSGGS